MLVIPHVPVDPLWKSTGTTLYICGEACEIWFAISRYILEQGGWHVMKVRPEKAYVKIERLRTARSIGFIFKVRMFVTDTGLLAVEWQRRTGCAWEYNKAWVRFRSSFGPS